MDRDVVQTYGNTGLLLCLGIFLLLGEGTGQKGSDSELKILLCAM